MIVFLIFMVGVLFVVGVCALAAWSDVCTMKIPNIYSLAIVGAFPVVYGLVWLLGGAPLFSGLFSHILGGVIVFVVTAPLFFLRVMGAADSKLGSALGLWLGIKGVFPFVVYMSVFGGLLAVLTMAIKRLKPFQEPKEGTWIYQIQNGANKVPYGVAIFIGMLWAFWDVGYLNPAAFVTFF